MAKKNLFTFLLSIRKVFEVQINNNSHTNFKATRILTARKILPQKTLDVIEVFRINKKQDFDFIKNCNNLLKKNKKS